MEVKNNNLLNILQNEKRKNVNYSFTLYVEYE
jgi:hypothetical protein